MQLVEVRQQNINKVVQERSIILFQSTCKQYGTNKTAVTVIKIFLQTFDSKRSS